MAASSFFNMINLPKPCPKFHLAHTNLPLNLNYSIPKPRTKTTSFARINNSQEAHLAKEEGEEEEDQNSSSSSTVMMSQLEQIVQLLKGLAQRPLEFAVDVIAPPGTPISEASLRFFLAAVAVLAVVPGGSWEWWLAKSLVCAGLVFVSAFLFLLSSFLE